MKPYYLDYMATTPIDPVVAKKIYSVMIDPDLQASWTSQSYYGKQVAKKRLECFSMIAKNLDADPEGIIFTSSATESIQSVIMGTFENYHRSGNHFISLKTEHHASLAALEHVEKLGAKVTLLDVNQDGLVDLDLLEKSLGPRTLMVTLSYVNSEIGVIQPIEAIAKICHEKGILLHIDATQAIGKIPVSFEASGADYMSFSAHKFYGPRAIGAMIYKTKPNRQFTSLIRSHHAQISKRPGTESIAQIIGMSEALIRANKDLHARSKHVEKLAQKIIISLNGQFDFHGSMSKRVPHNLNIDTRLNQENLNLLLQEFAVSQASACTNTTFTDSHVLKAIGLESEVIQRSIRVSLSHLTESKVIEIFVKRLTSLQS